jgi:acetyl-CoA C-acetyltransferase
MRLNKRTAVIGCALSAPEQADAQSLEELLFDVAQAAMKDAGLDIDDIDGIVVAANDQLDGRAISVMAASGSVGGVGRDILSTPSAGEHAFVMGALRIASGQYRTQLVVAWSPTEAVEIAEVERLAADPYYHRRLPLDDLSSFALQASALQAKAPGVAALAQALVSERAGAKTGPKYKRWPLTLAMTPPARTGAVALVLADEDFVAARGRAAAWIKGMHWTTETGFLGDRDLSTAPALQTAARVAFEDAGVASPRTAFDVIEVSDATPYQLLLAMEALGLSARNDWARDIKGSKFDFGEGPKVNPSGGFGAVNAVFCEGLTRIAEAARQVLGRAGAHQVRGVETALAHAASGFAMQYQTVVVLGQDR